MASSLGGENFSSNKEISAPVRDRTEKFKLAKERQNEERQKKIEELKVQAEAAQKFREQKEEERKRRIDELRNRDNEKRSQVEERKKAIIEAEQERREYILRRNHEREARMINKRKNERSSTSFAFGSSTPRLLDPSDFGGLATSSYWGHRRSTSITNVAYNGGGVLSRRSSERDLADNSKKRASSAGGIDVQNNEKTTEDAAEITYRSVARRKTDLMPTIPSPREQNFGSRSSLHSHSHTPRTPGRAVSMTRLDQLAKPTRRNGEHIRAIIEREIQQQLFDENNKSSSLNSQNTIKMSKSMTHLSKSPTSGKASDNDATGLQKLNKNHSFKSMSTLNNNNNPRNNISTKKFLSRFTKKIKSNVEKKDPNEVNMQTGSRSGNITPTGSVNDYSRPDSAMSNSMTAGSSFTQRRKTPLARKPRPASIAVCGGSSLSDEIKQKKDKPPLPKVQSTPKRLSLSKSNSSSKLSSSVEKKLSVSIKKDFHPDKIKTSTPKADKTEPVSKVPKEEKNQLESKAAEIEKGVLIETVKVETTEFNHLTPTRDKEKINQTISSVSKIEKEAFNSEKVMEMELTSANIEANGITEMNEKNSYVENLISVDLIPDLIDTKEKSQREIEEKKIVIDSIEQIDRSATDMTASMIAKKITTEEEAKAALAEKRRLARIEAQNKAELEKQRLEAQKLEELRLQAEEEERQRLFEEETNRLAEEQRKSEEERLQQAIEEAKKREKEELVKRQEEELLKVEKEEAEKKAKEEAEKQRLETAEKLKREEAEREERRKRVEAIMSRTRKPGATPNSTPTKDGNGTSAQETKQENQTTEIPTSKNKENNEITQKSQPNDENIIVQSNSASTQALYEQSVIVKENNLMKTCANLISDENGRNNQNIQNSEVTNGTSKQLGDIEKNSSPNGNGHFENLNNKNDFNQLVDIASEQLVDFSTNSQLVTDEVIFNNNNNLLNTSTNLVTADSHENKEISLL